MRTTLAKVLIGLLVVVGPACGDDDDGDSAATTTIPPADVTTTTTPKVDDTTTTVAVDLGDEPPFHDDGTSGSGCAPGDDTALPDGWWYGTVEAPPGASVEFDLACYYVGAAAEEIAASRDDFAPNGFFVVNDNEGVRTLAVDANATASCVELTDALAMVDCAPTDVDGPWDVWLRVQGGTVDRIVEQYAP